MPALLVTKTHKLGERLKTPERLLAKDAVGETTIATVMTGYTHDLIDQAELGL